MADEDVNIFDFDKMDFGFPEKPVLVDSDPKSFYQDLLITDEDSYLKKYGTPTLSDEEIEALYTPSDFSGQKKLALAQFGFGLMRPTEGGRIGEPLSQAGQQLAANLSKIKSVEQQDLAASRKGIISAKLQRQAAEIANRKSIYDANRGVEMTMASALHNKAITQNETLLKAYNDQFSAAQKLKIDYKTKVLEPKKGQFRLPLADGTGYGDPFIAYTVITADGPQFYKPTGQLDEDGIPQMELIVNPAGIQEMTTAMSGSPDDYSKMGSVSQILDIKNQIDTYDKNIMYLNDLRLSVGTNKMRAGFLAGLKFYGQDFAQIISDAIGTQWNDQFADGYTFKDGTKISKNTKYQPIHSTVEAFLSQPDQVQKYIDAGYITPEDVENMKNLSGSFDEIAASGEGLKMSDGFGPNGEREYGKEAMFSDGYHEIFESVGEQEKIANKLGWYDSDLPLNQARANAIIYAIARARKSSGRLNLDDIQRAAQDLNLYGFTSAAAVVTKLEFLENDLRLSRMSALDSFAIIPQFAPVYQKLIDMGYDKVDFDRLREQISKSKGDTTLTLPKFVIMSDGSVKMEGE